MSVAGLPKPAQACRSSAGGRRSAARSTPLRPTRLTNVAIGNRIGVLDEGRITQESTYDQLTQEPRLFQSLQRRSGGAA